LKVTTSWYARLQGHADNRYLELAVVERNNIDGYVFGYENIKIDDF
jgi:hypothetical protein